MFLTSMVYTYIHIEYKELSLFLLFLQHVRAAKNHVSMQMLSCIGGRFLISTPAITKGQIACWKKLQAAVMPINIANQGSFKTIKQI